jgi:hypothetical protein
MPKHPIDELFEKKLQNYEVEPSASLWSKIETKPQGQYRRLGFVRNYKIYAVATSVVLTVFFMRFWYVKPHETPFIQNSQGLVSKLNDKKADNMNDKKVDNMKANGKKANDDDTTSDSLHQKSSKIVREYNHHKPNHLNKNNVENPIQKDDLQEVAIQKEDEKKELKEEKKEDELLITITLKLSAEQPKTLLADTKQKTKAGRILKKIKDVKNGDAPLLGSINAEILTLIFKPKQENQ